MELILSRAEMRYCTETVYPGSRGTVFAVVFSFVPLGLALVFLFTHANAVGCILPPLRGSLFCYLKSRTTNYGQNAVYISVLKHSLPPRSQGGPAELHCRLNCRRNVCAPDRSL